MAVNHPSSAAVIEPEKLAADETAFRQLQDAVRRNKQTVLALRREKRELESALDYLETEGSASATYQQTELTKSDRKLAALRRKRDELIADVDRKRGEIDRREQRLRDLDKEGRPLLADDSPMAVKIRMLENRLDKAMIKYNEATAIRSTYDAITKRLKKERVGFDNQLAAIERTLRAKDHDFQELLNMSHDANHAKDVQKQELVKFRALFEEQRAQKKADLLERRGFVDTCIERTQRLVRQEKTAKQELEDPGTHAAETPTAVAARPTGGEGTADNDFEAQRVAEYEEALTQIKEVTGATDIDDIIAKFAAQEETHRSLSGMAKEAKARLETINAEKAQHQRLLEEIKYVGNGQHGSRRIVDDSAVKLTEAQHACSLQRAAYERVARMFIHIKAGVEHLHDKLAAFHTNLPSSTLTDDTILDVLRECELKLQLMVEELPAGAVEGGIPEAETPAQYLDRLASAAASGKVLLPAHNQRVRLGPAEVDDDDRDDDGDDDEDVLDRPTIKKMAALAVQRETRKQKRRRPGGQ